MATAASSTAEVARAKTYGAAAPLAYWHLLSLDAPCVAALWTIAFARVFFVALPWTAPAALGLAVWILYVLDRLSDARRVREPLADRHRFHHRHRAALLGCVCGSLPALVLLIVWLPSALRTGWLLLAVPMLGYAVAVHALHLPRVPKEVLVGSFFACAAAMPVFVAHRMGAASAAAAILFGAVCWLNCAAIARWERARTADVATAFVVRHLSEAALMMMGLALCLALVSPIGVALACSAAALLLLNRQNTMQPLTRRALADAALLTPLLLWLFV